MSDDNNPAEATSTPAAEPTPTPVSEPTPTVEPTPTIEPTPVSEPTPTAEPAPTATPSETEAKKPMDKKKKNIIIWSCVGGGLAIIGIIVGVVLAIVLNSVDYKESFKVAEDADEVMYSFRTYYYECSKVASYVTTTFQSEDEYQKSIDNCKKALSDEYIPVIKKVESTSAVQHDKDIKEKFEIFNTEFKKITDNIDGELDSKFEVYKSWHNFIVNANNLNLYTTGISDTKIDEVAAYAINSGNDKLKEYATEWATKFKAALAAKKEYDSEGYTKFSEYMQRSNDFNEYVKSNQPDLTKILPLAFADNYNDIATAWNDLYETMYIKFKGN